METIVNPISSTKFIGLNSTRIEESSSEDSACPQSNTFSSQNTIGSTYSDSETIEIYGEIVDTPKNTSRYPTRSCLRNRFSELDEAINSSPKKSTPQISRKLDVIVTKLKVSNQLIEEFLNNRQFSDQSKII